MEGKDGESDTANDDFDDEAECAVISYNMAVVHYQVRSSLSCMWFLRACKRARAVCLQCTLERHSQDTRGTCSRVSTLSFH